MLGIKTLEQWGKFYPVWQLGLTIYIEFQTSSTHGLISLGDPNEVKNVKSSCSE